MPIEFLSDEQKNQYGHFSCEPNDVQLSRYFHLDEADLAFILRRRGDKNRLGFALQLTSARFLGTFLSDVMLAPAKVQVFVARQLAIKDMDVLANYAQRDTTKREHTALIRKHYGYREFSDPPWAFRLSRLLYTRAWISNERPSLMFDFATAWLIQNKILLPGISTLTRLISEIRERAANRLWKRLSSLPSDEKKQNWKRFCKYLKVRAFLNLIAFEKAQWQSVVLHLMRLLNAIRHCRILAYKSSISHISRQFG